MAHSIIKCITGAGLALSLAGCAHTPELMHMEGSRPTSGTYMFLPSAGGERLAIQPLVGDHLQSTGLQYSAPEAIYLVQTAISRRPARAGAYVPSEQAKWMRTPYRSSAPLSLLTVTISNASDGTEVFRASSGSWSKRPLDMTLAAEMVANIFNPAGRAEVAKPAAR